MNTLLVHFKHAGTGLSTTDGKAPIDFLIAGADQQFVKATAKLIDADTIALQAPGLSKPVAVRYAWQNSPKQIWLAQVIGPGNLPHRLLSVRIRCWEHTTFHVIK